jgi:hypothetical protein
MASHPDRDLLWHVSFDPQLIADIQVGAYAQTVPCDCGSSPFSDMPASRSYGFRGRRFTGLIQRNGTLPPTGHMDNEGDIHEIGVLKPSQATRVALAFRSAMGS